MRTSSGREWEWDGSPELTFAVVDALDAAIELFNRYSPRLAASLISGRPREHDASTRPWTRRSSATGSPAGSTASSPSIGPSSDCRTGNGRLFGRGGVLAGDSIVTVRARATQLDPELHR